MDSTTGVKVYEEIIRITKKKLDEAYTLRKNLDSGIQNMENEIKDCETKIEALKSRSQS